MPSTKPWMTVDRGMRSKEGAEEQDQNIEVDLLQFLEEILVEVL